MIAAAQEQEREQEQEMWAEAAALAVRLAREAGDYAVAEQSRARITEKGGTTDLVTHVDLEAERRIAAAIAEVFPDHAILGEEHGDQGAETSRWRWLIDPLDGTNNYALGLDVYGVCITLCDGQEPIVAVIQDSPGRRTFRAVRGQGAWSQSDGGDTWERLRIPPPQDLSRSTISWLQGYRVGHEDPDRERMFAALEHGAKRVLRTWAPSADWGLLLSGGLGGIAAYRNEVWDSLGGVLLATEAGAATSTAMDGTLLLVAPEPLLGVLLELLIEA